MRNFTWFWYLSKESKCKIFSRRIQSLLSSALFDSHCLSLSYVTLLPQAFNNQITEKYFWGNVSHMLSRGSYIFLQICKILDLFLYSWKQLCFPISTSRLLQHMPCLFITHTVMTNESLYSQWWSQYTSKITIYYLWAVVSILQLLKDILSNLLFLLFGLKPSEEDFNLVFNFECIYSWHESFLPKFIQRFSYSDFYGS